MVSSSPLDLQPSLLLLAFLDYLTALQLAAPCLLAQQTLPLARTLALLCRPLLHLLAPLPTLQHLALLKSAQNDWPAEPTTLYLHATSFGSFSRTHPGRNRALPGLVAMLSTAARIVSSRRFVRMRKPLAAHILLTPAHSIASSFFLLVFIFLLLCFLLFLSSLGLDLPPAVHPSVSPPALVGEVMPFG